MNSSKVVYITHNDPPEARQLVQRHMIEWEGKASEGMARVIAPQLQEPLIMEGDGGTTVEDIFEN